MKYLEAIEKYPIHWALGGGDTSGGMEQNPQELNGLCEFIGRKKIKTFLEIGMAHGYLQRFMKEEMGLAVEGINPVELEDVTVTYVGKSQSQAIINSVGSYDMIFVDGDHSYEAVRADYLNYRGKCRYMAFHDILGKRNCEGVAKLWAEIKPIHISMEIIGDNPETASGIGIIAT